MTIDKSRTATLLTAALLALFLTVTAAAAQMREIGDRELATVTGQAGVSIFSNLQISFNADTIKFSDSELSDWIEFQGFSIHDGSGGPFLIQTPDYTPITIDIGTYANGQTALHAVFPHYVQPRYYSIDSLVFCDTAIGGIDIAHMTQSPITLIMGSHADGSEGIDFAWSSTVDIDAFSFSYNDLSDSISLDGIHLYGSATGAAEDPSTWVFSGDFQIGQMETSPATIDMATNASGQTTMQLDLPMQGTLRIEDINFGGKSFGPCAIDGMTVHRLAVTLTP